MLLCVMLLFFFRQKTAYAMRIGDWSSDVCSSYLVPERPEQDRRLAADRVDDAGSGVHGDEESGRLLEDVRQGQDRKHPFIGTDGEDLRQLLRVRSDESRAGKE